MMRSKSKPTCSKSLVRNAEVPVIPALTCTGSKNKNYPSKNLTAQKKSYQTNQNDVEGEISLGEPVLNTALRIVKEMKQTSNMKPLRVQNPPDFSEKVTQKMNVPYNEHLYHDLVALSVSDIPLVDNMSSVKVKPHKQDQSPDLSEFIRPNCVSDIPVVVTHTFSHHSHPPEWDGCKVYLSTEKVRNDCYN